MTARSWCHRGAWFYWSEAVFTNLYSTFTSRGASGRDDNFKNAKKGLDKISLVIVP